MYKTQRKTNQQKNRENEKTLHRVSLVTHLGIAPPKPWKYDMNRMQATTVKRRSIKRSRVVIEKPANRLKIISDQLLVECTKAGNKDAYDLLVLKHQQKIVKLIMQYIPDSSEALDVSQEAFLKAYRALSKFRGDSAFYTWLYRVAVNTAKNHILATSRRPLEYASDINGPENLEWHTNLQDTNSPEGYALSDEFHHKIEEAIVSLPDNLRISIILREVDGLSYEEISEAMECPVGTVRSRIFRARGLIKNKM
jgi:RNA polymerase sigma-70 factor (ECF subfamily)